MKEEMKNGNPQFPSAEGICEEENQRQTEKAVMQKKPRIILWILGGILAVFVLVSLFPALKCFALGHKWQEATCTMPKTCSVCDAVEGTTLSHQWKAATCSAPKTCAICGTTEGMPQAHHWEAATCTIPKTCSLCGITEGSARSHQWLAATCTAPETCSLCGATNGVSLGHCWSSDSSDVLQKCERCLKAYEYYYRPEEEAPLVWTEYDIGEDGVLTNPVSHYTKMDKTVEWMNDGQVQAWSSYELVELANPYMYCVDGKVYYFDNMKYSVSENNARKMAQIATRYVSFRTYMWFKGGRNITLANGEDWDFFSTKQGSASLAVDADGTKYIIVHKGDSDEAPLDTYAVKSEW